MKFKVFYRKELAFPFTRANFVEERPMRLAYREVATDRMQRRVGRNT